MCTLNSAPKYMKSDKHGITRKIIGLNPFDTCPSGLITALE